MTIDLTSGEFRQLLDMVYIGNWILNSTRGDDRIVEYDRIESKIFGLCSGTPLSRAGGEPAGDFVSVPGLCRGRHP